MSEPVVRAGRMEELERPVGDWVFVDMGFSNKTKSCGLLVDRAGEWSGQAAAVRFGDAARQVQELARRPTEPLHLVLEAPLSALFDRAGNPMPRAGERHEDGRTRYWYVGLGCAVKVSALFFLKQLADTLPQRQVRLFEGFVSFKDKGKKSDHAADVHALRDAVRGAGRFLAVGPLAGAVVGRQTSLLEFLGGASDLPPIIFADAL